MANSCGIDLGTTNSCIVIVEDGEPRVVRDQYDRVTVPSVVYQDGKGNIAIGHAAKARLGQMPPPIITIKRKMGTDEKVRLGGQERSAVEISQIILAYLKQLGEEAARTTLDSAIVTVPAYFNFKQKQDTETAARAAGFKEVIVLQEPVAAALAYCVSAGEEPMIVLAYDLGGGTFDVTVLERTADNEINVLAFGGDPWLGGDDFDTLLAEYLRQQLQAKHYAVDWDLHKPEQYAKFQKLKEQAEDAKKKLSRTPEVSVLFPQVFSDEEGTLVDLDEVVTRETFYGLIGDKIERSITLTRETLERSGVPVAKISKLIMVGGSSYMPRIQERLRETFGLTPELVDPETIVAVGAAIKAATQFGRRIDGQGITVDLDYQARTARPKTRVSGRLSQRVQNWTARLLRGEFETTLELQGERFRFDEIPLTEGKTNEFTLILEDETGAERLYADLPITHDAAATNLRTPDALVAKPIAVRTVSGLEVVIEAGVRLPTKVNQTFVTEDQSGSIRVPICEGSVPIAEVQLSNVPPSLPVGSEVDVELTFNQDYSVRAHAHVRDTGHEAHAHFEIPPVRVQTVVQVQTRLGDIAARWVRAGEAGGRSDRASYRVLQQAIEEELGAREPKMAKVAEDLSELESLLLQAEAQAVAQQALRPPLAEVERRLNEAEQHAQEKGARGSFDVQQFRAQAADVRRQARDCWERQDAAGWRETVSMLVGLERIAAPSFDINQMPEAEARDLALALAHFIESEVSTKRAARELLHGINLDALKFEAIRNPRDAATMGITLLGQLVQAGITERPGGNAMPQLGGIPAAGHVVTPEGLLGSRRT